MGAIVKISNINSNNYQQKNYLEGSKNNVSFGKGPKRILTDSEWIINYLEKNLLLDFEQQGDKFVSKGRFDVNTATDFQNILSIETDKSLSSLGDEKGLKSLVKKAYETSMLNRFVLTGNESNFELAIFKNKVSLVAPLSGIMAKKSNISVNALPKNLVKLIDSKLQTGKPLLVKSAGDTYKIEGFRVNGNDKTSPLMGIGVSKLMPTPKS